jgi:cardiolipin synthase
MAVLWRWLLDHLAVAGIVVEAIAFALVPAVLVRRREPSSTVAWILTLVFLPGLGALLFLLHGRDRMRWPAKRKRAADDVVAAKLAAARSWKLGEEGEELAALDPNERRIFRVCTGLESVELSSGNHVTLFTDGRLATAAMERAIEAAERCVFAEYYLIRDDAAGARFREHLARAAARGVEVRLLVDAYGCFWLPKRWYRPLRDAGVRVAAFLPMSEALRLPLNLRTHRKILVVDGKLGFTGGLNIGNEYVADTDGEPRWRDTHLGLRGPAVASLASIFLQDWHFNTGMSEVTADYFPEPSEHGPAALAVVPSGPDRVGEPVHRTFFAAIVGARHRVWITTPYFVPDKVLLVALQTAALRGVDVQIILPSRSNHRVTQAAGRSYYAELLEHGVALYEYLPGMLHAKTMLVDHDVSLVGSANMDARSFRLNFEVHTLIHDESLGKALDDAFREDRARSRRVELERWAQRPFRARVAEGAARLVSPIL